MAAIKNTFDFTVTPSELYLQGEKVKYSEPSNILFGKKWAACGDSITRGAGNDDGTLESNPTYARIIAERNCMNLYNDGNDGTTLGQGQGTYFSGTRYTQVPKDVDYITLWFGINDSSHSDLGTIDDADDSTYYGAYNVVLKYFMENMPNAKIGLVVTHCGAEAFHEATRAIAQKYGLGIFDIPGDARIPLWHSRDSSLTQPDATVQAQRQADWFVDGQHPNAEGYRQLATSFEAWLKTL